MSMIPSIRTALKTLGYKTVHASRQEKIGTDELLVILDDVDIEVADTRSYHCHAKVIIEWDTMNGDTIPLNVCTLVDKLEQYMYDVSTEACRNTFKFVQCELNPIGQMYRITIMFQYTEVIDLD